MARLMPLLLLLLLPAAWAVSSAPTPAPVYYQADPVKLAQLEAQRCNKLTKESTLIRRRMAGFNRPYDLEKLKQRLAQLEADYARYCSKAQSAAPSR
ncbi:hypothetical protein JHS3_17430 [Jeongeupia sp. HS-3]|uniref:hypothetical protein n=1 Tax=Jeongeupia sp. HS-3 TaxID=1009682 RepID=UPI0018A3CDAE|nr:hypothetical protein [Jeongeupia sp. HS-3]BCL76007.1 hypothetical protein JHS3_17430 [Jeongeupia sp. HS-3]